MLKDLVRMDNIKRVVIKGKSMYVSYGVFKSHLTALCLLSRDTNRLLIHLQCRHFTYNGSEITRNGPRARPNVE